jgi:uncharacterized protein (TIGR00255 family)
MIKSMTGYGIATFSDQERNISVEIKSLNSKYFDLSLRLPKTYSEFEPEWRNLLSELLERGKISLSIDFMRVGKAEIRQVYNQELFGAYYQELKKLSDSVGTTLPDQLFSIALNAPDVIQSTGRETVSSEEKKLVESLIRSAIEKCEAFRKQEGKVLEIKLKDYILAIGVALDEIILLDPKRIEKIRTKIKGAVTEFFGAEGYDTNRLEQEMIYYIEKLDIHEERVRLRAHLDYFLRLLEDPQSNGKKLGFLAQEIGREINTIGSKAADAAMQTFVVQMKEELEKIKEQLNNVL